MGHARSAALTGYHYPIQMLCSGKWGTEGCSQTNTKSECQRGSVVPYDDEEPLISSSRTVNSQEQTQNLIESESWKRHFDAQPKQVSYGPWFGKPEILKNGMETSGQMTPRGFWLCRLPWVFRVYRDSLLFCNKSWWSLSVGDEISGTCHFSEVYRYPVIRDMVEYALLYKSQIAAFCIPITNRETLLPGGSSRF